MSRLHQSFLTFAGKLLAFVTRPQSNGLRLIRYALAFASLAAGSGWFSGFRLAGNWNGTSVDFTLQDGPFEELYLLFLFCFLVCFFLGVVFLILEFADMSNSRIFAIEIRGLRDWNGPKFREGVLRSLKGRKQYLQWDIREQVQDGKISHPKVAADKLVNHATMLKDHLRSEGKYHIAVAGLAPVPFMFLAGVLLDDENSMNVYDWDREGETWAALTALDDGDRLAEEIPETLVQASEVVLAVSCSYMADFDSIAECFPDLPVAKLTLHRRTVDNHWSATKQAAISMQVLQAIKQLGELGARRIHLVLAAQSSVAFNCGRRADKNNCPELCVYNYRPGSQPAYEWGVLMPTRGNTRPEILYP